ncbi:short-subunit dehydrogenase [Sinobaca qinghaiensis]|uniref:Short-subunit dehydrogenase n=1 Tax=Sinobaca qinghaiensis TaxID=342944 RepID=A0A419V0F1_9BACL|nr:SDR family NAD(P)-dependent oxidoreductase [Sinobaca qinghaiensis]RKD71340.1 short-subunit dehydrogenase [Sinobaca qinghaiensis]
MLAIIVSNKVIVVTGAGGGIGSNLVHNLLSKGARVAAVDIDEEALEKLNNKAGEKNEYLSTHRVNLTNREEVEALPEQVIAHHGTVDGVINNAGIIQPFINISELDIEKIQLVMDINFYGTLYMTKVFLPYLLKRPTAHITNLSSMGGFVPVPGQSIYGASKAAVKLLTEGLYSELKGTNVNVTIVFPGAVATDIIKNSGAEGDAYDSIKKANSNKKVKPFTPKEAADIIIEGMERNKYRVLAGRDSKLLDVFNRLNPKFAAGLIAKNMNFK